MWVTPTEEEIFKVCKSCHNKPQTMSHASQRYSPELQKKALARREQTQQDFMDFTTQLKEAARSEKPSMSFLR
jgi:cytochrome c2